MHKSDIWRLLYSNHADGTNFSYFDGEHVKTTQKFLLCFWSQIRFTEVVTLDL